MNYLEKANSLIHGDREKDYGHPRDNLNRIAAVWNVLLGDRLKEPLTAADVCGLMAGLKLIRAAKDHWTHEDSLVDLCGYVGLVERIKEPTNGANP
jgi:hypothetical protein